MHLSRVASGKLITMRHEEKFICSEKQLALLQSRIQALLPMDAHQDGEDYQIRSLYFDSPDLQCVRENAAGVSTREKYRVRIYNCDSNLLTAGKLYRHLAEIDQACEERMDLLIRQMAKQEGVTEALKASNQMEWARRMNIIRSCAEEIVLHELVFG